MNPSFDASPEQRQAAQGYESLFVPALFDQWPIQVFERLQVSGQQALLDVACGTGVVARQAARRLDSGSRVVGVDLGAGMLSVAAELTPNLEWHLGDATSLPFEDASFDRLVCQFGLMFFADRDAALREWLRVMRPGGRMAVLTWNHLDSMPVHATEVEILQRIGGQAAADALRAPFCLHDGDQLQTMMANAGGQDIQLETLSGQARFPSIRSLLEADVTGWLPIMGVNLSEEVQQRIFAEAEKALAGYCNDKGELVFELSVQLVTASR